MYLIEVIPIQSGTKKPLTYYSKAQLLRGALVEIEIRSKKTTGIVASVQPASSARSNLRTSSYQIKKISKIIQERPVALHILTVAESVSDKTLAPASKILEKLVPEWTWSSDHYLNNYKPDTDSDELLYEYLVFQAPQKERMTYYRTMVREMLAKKKTLLIVVPTYAHIERYYSFLEKGVGNRIIQLHGKLTQKKITEAYTKLKKDTGWIVLATPSMSMYPLPSLGKILLDTESHSTYHTMARPFLDLRYVFQSRAMYQNIPIIFAGSFVSLSHHLSLEDGTARALRPVISRVEFPHSIERVIPGDPAQKKHPPVKKNDEFMMLEKPIHEKLKKIREQGESVLVFVSRKGLAPVTVCQDCRNVLRAPETGVPLVLIKSKNGRRKFRDPKTGQEYPANTVCPTCTSWRLESFGIGTQSIEKEIQETLKMDTLVIDKDHTKTHVQVQKALEKWNPKKTVLIANELILPYLNEFVDHIIIGSIDSMYSLPRFDTSESIVRLIMRLAEHAKYSFTIQTRVNDTYTMDPVVRKNISRFTRKELTLRKQLGLPPATWQTILKKSLVRKNLQKENDVLVNMFEKWDPVITAHQGHRKNLVIITTTIYTEQHPGSIPDLFARLFSLGNDYTVQCNQ